MEEVTYGNTFKYVPDWGRWEIIRELWSNAHDSGAPFEVRIENGSLIVEDQGDGIALSNLLIGEHDQKVQNSIGQFGEGLKMSMLVCIRMGMSMMVETGKYIFIPGKKLQLGIETLKVDVDTTPNPRHGTKITIDGWGDELFSSRFVMDEDDSRVIFSVDGGSAMFCKNLFNKGVYVQALDSYEFGYDLHNLTMNRDRSTVNDQDVFSAVGKLWSKVDWSGAWKYFFKACQSKKQESGIYIWSDNKSLPAVQEGFYLAFGENACLETNEDATREVNHRGGKVVPSAYFGHCVQNLIKNAGVLTDEGWLKEQGVKKYRSVGDRELAPEQRKVLALLRKMGSKVGCGYRFEAAEFPHNGECDHEAETIRVNKELLNREESAKVTGIHELAHALYKHDDMTEQFVRDCCRVGVMLMK